MSKKHPGKETWAGAFRAIGIRAISTGKFLQFIFLCVILMGLYTTNSADKVKIVSMLVASPIVNILGWLLALTVSVGCVTVYSVLRKEHLGEIERLSQERDKLQEKLLKLPVQHSNYTPR
jgi:hypothetical protein